MNTKNCVEMTTYQVYIQKVSGVKYGWKVDDVTRAKGEKKDLIEMTLNNRTLSKI